MDENDSMSGQLTTHKAIGVAVRRYQFPWCAEGGETPNTPSTPGAVIASVSLGAARVNAFSWNPARQELARTFGTTNIVPEHGDVLADRIHPGRASDFETNLDGIAEAYAAISERRAIKFHVRMGTSWCLPSRCACAIMWRTSHSAWTVSVKRRTSILVLIAAVLTPLAPVPVLQAAAVRSLMPAGHSRLAQEPATRAGPPRLARVHYIYRGLAVQPPQRSRARGRIGDPLFDRYFLQTTANQKASIRFQDGTFLHMNQQTDAVLRTPHLTVVERGEIAEYLAPGTDHRVQTATAVAGAIGTTYDVRVNGGTAIFVVLHGALQVANQSGAVVVKSNQQTTVTAHNAPAPPSPVDARAVFAWTNGIPAPDLGEDVALDANGGVVVGSSSQREGNGDRGHAQHINDGLLTEGWQTATGAVSNQ